MEKTVINIVYAHLKPDFISSFERGNVLLIYSSRPLTDCDMHVYWDAFSFHGRQKGLNVLLLMEPSVVLPGQYNKEIWDRFDHVFTLYDALIEKYGFTKYRLARQGFHPWFGESTDTAITEGQDERELRYPLRGRKNAICLINGNKHSSVPGELYSKRIEAALWFHLNSGVPFDVYGFIPFFLPNYRGPIENNNKLLALSRYKYSLCFENTGDPVLARGYVDKILDSLESRTLPIYLGCPNVEEYIPKTCFIDLRDFADYRGLDTYLRDIPEDEYARYIDNIDRWVNEGGLRPYSWYPLYDDLVRYYARQKGADCERLFGNDTTWRAASFNGNSDFAGSPPLWTFEEHSKTPSPLIDYREKHGRIEQRPDSEHITRAIEFAKKGMYGEAVEAMAWLHFHRNPDLFCFYAQLLHMLGFFETESVFLTFALQLDSNHLSSRKQLNTPCSTREDLQRAVSYFEDAISNKKIETEMVPGLTSIIVHVSHFNENAKRCIESVRTHAAAVHEVIIIRNKAAKIPGWLDKITSGDDRCRVMDAPPDTGRAPDLNKALKTASGEYILILDENAVIFQKTLPNLLECMNRHPEHGMVVPMSNRAAGTQEIPKTGGLSFRDFEEYAKALGERNRHRYVAAFEIDPACVLIKRGLLDTIGLFKEHYAAAYHMVNDLRMRALIEGRQTMVATDSCIYLDQDGRREKIPDRLFDEQWSTFSPNSEAGRKLSPFVAMKNARDLYGKSLLSDAIQAVMEGIRYTPDDEALYYCLAEILFDAKLYEQSMEAIGSLPGKGKEKLEAIEMLGSCSYHLDNIEEAQSYIEHALAISADSVKAIDLAGLLALQLGEQEKAETFFRQAIAIDPGFADPYVHKGVMAWQDNKEKEALGLIEKGFILSPETTDFSTTYHSAATSLNELARAERVFLEATGLFPLNKKLFFYYIGVLLQQEKYAEAMEETEKAMTTFGVDEGILAAAMQIRDRLGPMAIDGPNRQGSLSVCMIVKDEEDKIARCLASLKPVADEIIVVDTGSTDRTREISRVFGAQVHEFPWTDDFSEARNFSMSKAKGQWILVHDADEVISGRDYDKLRAVLGQHLPGPVAYSLVTRNYSADSAFEGWSANSGEYPDEETGTGWFPSPKVRLLVNDERLRFENPIHELLEPSIRRAGVEIRPCEVTVHHYGQADKERAAAKAQMYYDLGKKKLETAANREAAIRELAIQARALGRYNESIELWQEYVALRPDHYLPYFNMAGCYVETEEFDKAIAAAKKAFELNAVSKEVVQCYAAVSLFCGEINDGIRSLENLLQTIPAYPTGKMTLAAAYLASGMEEKGIQHLKEMKRTAFDCSEVLYTLSKKLDAAGRAGCAVLLLEGMAKSGHIHPEGAGFLEECRNKMNDKRTACL